MPGPYDMLIPQMMGGMSKGGAPPIGGGPPGGVPPGGGGLAGGGGGWNPFLPDEYGRNPGLDAEMKKRGLMAQCAAGYQPACDELAQMGVKPPTQGPAPGGWGMRTRG